MAYVDGFVLVVPKKNIAKYKRLATAASKVWKDHGALEYRECVADDINAKMAQSFGKLTRLKKNETVVFSWVVYKSKTHRDRVNKKIMADPRIQKMMKTPMPFDDKRMSYGGFKVIVDK